MLKGFFKVCLSIAAFSSPSFSFPANSSTLVTDNPKEIIDQVWQIIYRDFLDYSGKYKKEDWIKLRKQILSTKYFENSEAYEAIKDMLAKLDDPYTRFLDPKEFNEMRIDTTGELMGVGIQISLDEVTNEIVVVSPIEGTPAFFAGIKPNDTIVSIDGKPTENFSIDQTVKLIRGEKGTKVELGIIRDNKFLKISLIRDRIEINVVDSRINNTSLGAKIAYLRLKQFNAKSPKEMSLSINKLEKQNPFGYVLDLRSNPGGLLEASIEIARQWINTGTIVSTQTKDGITDIRKAKSRALTTRPVVVLIDEGSASASEILSGAIKDNKRGLLVGKKTFGKGLVQSVRSLSDGSGLTVTVAKYLTPNGKDINKNGIEPDIKVDLLLDDKVKLTNSDLGTLKDSQYVEAENILLRKYKSDRNNNNSYNPNKANINYALKR
ncbi:S41 family peptidase [Prochlorococcus marinus]|uniref:Peptidase S41 n=1 Tax=Prochlorococcus marinus XMU1408 TaxID=2213228 RepID=A0A318R5M7_PROMR|nr:S41 family peptidase [Prochlorococcus marinus]MBW3041702.1 peptidase S41 [Prochlorococcus marinus str. XMU1408]PYE02851.1 peptidase S41 [Prochlorococcus marinus XMU1408]